jgi:hypothetical protein
MRKPVAEFTSPVAHEEVIVFKAERPILFAPSNAERQLLRSQRCHFRSAKTDRLQAPHRSQFSLPKIVNSQEFIPSRVIHIIHLTR